MPRPRGDRRTPVLAVCCLSVLLVSIDTTILNVALPSVRRDLHSSVSGLQWTLDAYTIVLASLLTAAGATADRVGRRRIFQLGLVLFTTASALCSLAPATGWLVAFRMVQAVGGSMLTPVAMAILTNTFPEPRERARAIGVWGGVVGVSMAAGPVLGGVLVQSVGWRSVFWLNVPVGLAALVLTALFVPESRAAGARRADPVGQLLVIVLLGSLTSRTRQTAGAANSDVRGPRPGSAQPENTFPRLSPRVRVPHRDHVTGAQLGPVLVRADAGAQQQVYDRAGRGLIDWFVRVGLERQ